MARPVLKGTRENVQPAQRVRVLGLDGRVPGFGGASASSDARGGAVSVTVPNTGVRRAHQDYAGKVLVTQINYKDCVSEDYFTFTVNLGPGYGPYGLEVWAGTSCENADQSHGRVAHVLAVADPGRSRPRSSSTT